MPREGAILVRYEGDENSTAIYLSRRFYRQIFRKTRKEGSGYTVLRDIALLKYKSPTMTVGGDLLVNLICDLLKLMGESFCNKKEIADFHVVCVKALAKGQALWVSGDMYPELKCWWDLWLN